MRDEEKTGIGVNERQARMLYGPLNAPLEIKGTFMMELFRIFLNISENQS